MLRKIKQLKRKRWAYLIIVLIASTWFWFSLPDPIFNDPLSFVLEARDGTLLGAKIATDGQWRFPNNPDVPEKFKKAIIAFEDKRFYSHFGVDLLAIARAISLNIKEKSVVSGGSTLSMQVIRLSLNGKSRTYWQKFIEMILAVRMEIGYAKDQILSLYASNAPFGGNVVGLDAASWRYYGKEPNKLSWAEAATLAVLPNAPSLIHPGKNRKLLTEKRNRLLLKLLYSNHIDSTTYSLSIEEPLPDKPHALPSIAPHFLEMVQNATKREKLNARFLSTLDFEVQKNLNSIAIKQQALLKNQGIFNMGILVLDVKNNEVVGYLGNVSSSEDNQAKDVDIIRSERSTGSILKPFLYALSLQSGQILPKSLLHDIPTFYPSYRPENFSNTYDGVVPANEALSRSLNIPFVRLLHQYGVEKFHFEMRKMGMNTLYNPPDHYGLSLILGGAETTLWDITNIYCSIAKRLGDFYQNNGRYDENDFLKSNFEYTESQTKSSLISNSKYLTADAIWLTLEALTTLKRPNTEGRWEYFESTKKIGWKTGTSFGFRDAWAIGVTPNFCVGVWVGNADGEGRPGLTGLNCAAPVLFDVFDQLPSTDWFDQPYDAMQETVTCKKSGYLATTYCEIDTSFVSKNANFSVPCPYHKLLNVTKNNAFQGVKECLGNDDIKPVPWFILPPVEGYYYRTKSPEYLPSPPIHPDCYNFFANENSPLEIVYPEGNSEIFIPIGLDGNFEKVVFRAINSNGNALIYWHLNDEYLGETMEIHNFELSPTPGKHKLTIMDTFGNTKEVNFEIISKR